MFLYLVSYTYTHTKTLIYLIFYFTCGVLTGLFFLSLLFELPRPCSPCIIYKVYTKIQLLIKQSVFPCSTLGLFI